MAAKRLKVGDIFAFSVGDGMVACGQVIDMRGLPLVVVFQPRFPGPEPGVAEVLASPVALVLSTVDVLVTRGDWRIIGHGPVVSVPQLVFRVSIGSIDSEFLESYDKEKRRRARPEELDQVPPRTTVSPKGVERMFLALHSDGGLDIRDRVHTIEAVRARAGLL